MSEKNTKQVIVIRKDLNMRKGKIAAQAAHASLKVILDLLDFAEVEGYENLRGEALGATQGALVVEDGSALDVWINGPFTKICVYVNSERELLDVVFRAREAGLLTSLIEDSGRTEFGGVPTLTCAAIGPAFSSELDPITGGLPLL